MPARSLPRRALGYWRESLAVRAAQAMATSGSYFLLDYSVYTTKFICCVHQVATTDRESALDAGLLEHSQPGAPRPSPDRFLYRPQPTPLRGPLCGPLALLSRR